MARTRLRDYPSMQIRHDVPEIDQPSLWAEGEEEFGIDYPVGHKPPTPEESMRVLEEGGQFEPPELTAAEYRAETARMYPKRPPEGFQVPEFSDAGRHRYEQGIFREIQKRFRIPEGNPFAIDPTEAVDQAMATQWSKEFERMTGIPFAYVDQLEGKDLKYVNDQRLRFKADIYRRAERKLNYAKSFHEYAMSKYDTERKKVEGRKAQIGKERLRQLEIKPQARVGPKGERTWHEWNENIQDWEDTGKLVKEEKAETETLTIYDVKGKGRRVTVPKGEYTPPEGFTLEKPIREKPPSPIAKEKFAISKKITAGERRSELIKNKGDKNFYEANVAIFNTTNSRNEVAYWGIVPGKLYGTNEETKIIKLPASLIAKGLSPALIQQQANDSGKTIAEVLEELGLLR